MSSRLVYPQGAILSEPFYQQDVLQVAPALVGKYIVQAAPGVDPVRYLITETEAYRGEEDRACHASKGKTARTSIMYEPGGRLYLYLIYGMYWMLNIVTGPENHPQAALIRGIEGFDGPGKLTRHLQLDKSYNGESLLKSDRIWIEDLGFNPRLKSGTRIGIDYAGEIWKNKPWRWTLDE